MLSLPRALAEAPCPRPPPRRLTPGLDGGMLVRVSGSLSGDPTCGPARPPLTRPQLAALPGSGLLLHKMLSSGSLRRAVPLLGLQTKRWTLAETAVDRKTPHTRGTSRKALEFGCLWGTWRSLHARILKTSQGLGSMQNPSWNAPHVHHSTPPGNSLIGDPLPWWTGRIRKHLFFLPSPEPGQRTHGDRWQEGKRPRGQPDGMPASTPSPRRAVLGDEKRQELGVASAHDQCCFSLRR